MGGGASKKATSSPPAHRPTNDRRRNSADQKTWKQATNSDTLASVARLEALANLEAQNNPDIQEQKPDVEFLKHGCRVGYSSVLAVTSREEAQTLLSHIFTLALTRNPEKEIGGMLFYDEQTNAIVQVLEGPALAVRELLYSKIMPDQRHTAVKVLWDIDVTSRRFPGFGMKLGGTMEEVLKDGAAADDQQELLRLTYISQLTAKSRDEAYEHIQAILRCAIVTNPKLHIGGALFLNPRTLHVLQVLEGPTSAVRTLYDKIALDSRHTECKVLTEATVKERGYDQWGMQQGDSSAADWSPLRGYNNPKRRRGRENVTENVDVAAQEGASPAAAVDAAANAAAANAAAAAEKKLSERVTMEGGAAVAPAAADAIDVTPSQQQVVAQ